MGFRSARNNSNAINISVGAHLHLSPYLTSWAADAPINVCGEDDELTNFACLQLRLEEREDISGTLVIKCRIVFQQALVCI